MLGKIKPLGLAVVAALAATGVMASAAQATTTFTAGAASGKIEATQTTEQVFTTSAGTVRCTTSTQTGTYTSTSFTSFSVSPTYSGCKAFGVPTATVAVNGCTYKFIGQASGQLANVNLECAAGQDITVITTVCVVHIEPQTGLAHVKFTNTTTKSPDDVDAEATLTGIEYTPTPGCPGPGVGETHKDGTLTGEATVRAFDTTGKQVNLTVDP